MEHKPALTVEQIMEIAEKWGQRYIGRGCNPADVEEVKSEIMLAMVEAGQKAKEGEAVRSYQWAFARGRVKTFWAMRHDHAKGERPAWEVEAEAENAPAPTMREAVQNPERDAENDPEAAACQVLGLDSGEYGATFGDTLPANTPSPVDALEPETVQVQRMRVCLSKLPARLAEVLRRRFLEDQTLEEVAKVLNVTKERARQLEEKALEEMRWLMGAA